MVWDDRQGAPGFELPPYYAQRVDTVRPATGISVRRRATPSETEAQAERLFRDFKLGLVTLVVVALLLVAYFWDGEPERITRTRDAEETVLSIRLEGRRRSDVAMAATRAPVARPVYSTPSPARRLAAPAPATREAAAPRVHTVRSGETLSAIALRRYGNAAEWRVIFNSNRSRLRRPSDLRAGMRLVIPPKRSAARRSRMPGALARASPTRRE
jgi:nucleoid-associated protein YgaU